MNKQPYDKIYLIGWYGEYPRPTDFGDEVTWCQDPIGENDDCPDIEYIRADLVDEQLTQAQETIKAGFMGGESSNLNVIETLGKRVDELENALNEIILITPIDALNLPPDTRMKMIAREALQE